MKLGHSNLYISRGKEGLSYLFSEIQPKWILVLQAQPQEKEGSGELRIQAMSHRNAISWMT